MSATQIFVALIKAIGGHIIRMQFAVDAFDRPLTDQEYADMKACGVLVTVNVATGIVTATPCSTAISS